MSPPPIAGYGLKFDPYGTGAGAAAPARPSRLILARTQTLDTLSSEMHRYARRQVEGRSCLIAGARGSGKTTLIQRAHQEAADLEEHSGTRLIRVRLHGPSLLENLPPPEDDADKADKKALLYKHILKTVLINLYQTLAEELADAYQRQAAVRGAEALEMAAQLRITLDGAPSAATLRSFWERIGGLPRGVLMPDAERGTPAYRDNQGVAEIVALATASEAYRRCTGKYTVTKTDADAAGAKQELKGELSAKSSDIKQALISAASGLGVAATAQSTGSAPALSMAIGAATALLSLGAFSLSASRSRETTTREEMTFLPNMTVSGLVHRMPLVLRRLRQAGIAPIFVVDELDKIKCSEPLTDLASYLKFISADQAFFCFLTDRSYLVEMAAINRDRTDAVQRTIFTDLMFVTYQTRDLHAFLETVITPAGAAPGSSDAEELIHDAEALRYVMIHKSKMLPFDLVRVIREFKSEDDWLTLPLKSPRTSRVHQFHLALQLAIEYVLSSPLVAERVERDVVFAQTMYDALYYPTHRWYSGERTLDVSADAILSGLSKAAGYTIDIPDQDKQFLHEQVKTMLDLAANPARLVENMRVAIGEHRMTASVAVREAVPETPVIKFIRADTYEWVYNRYGTPHNAANVMAIVGDADLDAAIDVIDTMEATLARIVLRPPVSSVLAATDQAIGILQSFATMEIEA
jgi:hypothetical protein